MKVSRIFWDNFENFYNKKAIEIGDLEFLISSPLEISGNRSVAQSYIEQRIGVLCLKMDMGDHRTTCNRLETHIDVIVYIIT